MRKYILIAAMALALFGCSKDDSESLDDRLVDTEWYHNDTMYEALIGGVVYDVYEFVSTTKVKNYHLKNGRVYDSDGEFNYTLNYPNITIHRIESSGEKVDLDFYFRDDRTMIKSDVSNEYLPYAKYTKQ